MDQPSAETNPKKTSRVRKTSARTNPATPAAEPTPLDDLPEATLSEAVPAVAPKQPPPARRRARVLPASGMNYQSLAMVALVGTFILVLACICSWTLIAMTFFLNAPWG